jgi:hypothetical protein
MAVRERFGTLVLGVLDKVRPVLRQYDDIAESSCKPVMTAL